MFSCSSIGAPSNCKKEFAGATVTAVDGAFIAVVVGAIVAALEVEAAGAGGADALAAEVAGATAGVAVDVATGLATTGLAATAPAAVSLCAKAVEATNNGKASTAPKAQLKVRLCMAADFLNGVLGFMIKG